MLVQAAQALAGLDALFHPPALATLTRTASGTGRGIQQWEKASSPVVRLRPTSSQRPHPFGASVGVSARRLQAYQRRPLAPWPALMRSQHWGGTCPASRAADTGGPDGDASGSVHLTAST